jgi:hypothetical protein
MVAKEVALRLMAAGYKRDLEDSPRSMWRHPKQKCSVLIHYGGHVTIWYNNHPKHYCYNSAGGFIDK